MATESVELIRKLCRVGIESRGLPALRLVKPFKDYFDPSGNLIQDELDKLDRNLTRREVLARYLLLNAVLDQGPDMEGVGIMLGKATSILYDAGIKFFHEPKLFFTHLEEIIKAVNDGHDEAKAKRARVWAGANDSKSAKYSLFFAQSVRGMVSTRQVVDFVTHRWGTPIALFMLLQGRSPSSPQPLVDYLESFESAELMCTELKDDPGLGLGSAIGDKALHLFAKNYVSIYKLKQRTDKGWDGVSYELPLDSNAGRVLFRTGFLLDWTTVEAMENKEAIQEGRGKHGEKYIRVTNIRGISVDKIPKHSRQFTEYSEIVREHLRTGIRPQKVEIQRMPSLFIYELNKEGNNFSVADVDDGLMEVGTSYCFNTPAPLCDKCPVRDDCRGRNEDSTLITKYFT